MGNVAPIGWKNRYHDVMRAPQSLDKVTTPDGGELRLVEHGGVFTIRINGRELMSSRSFTSEKTIATLGCAEIQNTRRPRVLVAGLGLGFTLRATLDALQPDAEVVVAEVFPAVVQWNRTYLAKFADAPADDPRVTVFLGDVAKMIRLAPRNPFDLIILDVDNGPESFTIDRNEKLYGQPGIRRLRSALVDNGTLAVWSAHSDPPFEQRLEKAGFSVQTEKVHACDGKGPRHTIFLARRS